MRGARAKKFGVKPEGFRAPYWLISDRTIDRIKQFGFKYNSDFMDSDMPYMLEWRGVPSGLVELPVEWMLDDWLQFDTFRRSPEDAYKIWKAEFEGIYRLERYFGLTCHPQAISRISRLDMLEMLTNHGDGAEGGRLVRHWEGGSRLDAEEAMLTSSKPRPRRASPPPTTP